MRHNPTEDPIVALAKEALKYFHRLTRTRGETAWILDGEPEWVHEMVHAAHGDMAPDDWKFEFVREALIEVSEADDYESPELEPDVYNNELLAWLSSNINRPAYVDEAIRDIGDHGEGIMEDVGMGQLAEKEEVYWSVLDSLKARAKETEG